MILNEDYFKDLEIEDEDIIEDDYLDVDEPKHKLTLEEAKKLHKQYDYNISFRIDYDDESGDTTFFQTTLIPKLFKRLNTIFEMYGIEHSEYILSIYPILWLEDCDNIVEYGDYQLFCNTKWDKDKYINNTYDWVYINMYINYPKFNYKKAFRFIYTVLNLYRIDKQIARIGLKPNDSDDYEELSFYNTSNQIEFYSFDTKIQVRRNNIDNLSKKLTEEDKRRFYKSVIYHFFGYKVNSIDYEAIDRDVPFKPIIPR